MEDNTVQINKGGLKTASSVEKAIIAEMKEARLKEFRNKLKDLVVARDAAQKVLNGKNAEIQVLSDEYSDVLAPE